MNIKHIEINIGKACNNKCRFCMSSKSSLWDIKFVDIELLKEKLLNYYNKGYRSVGFLGGDVSIYPKLDQLIKFCREIGFIDIQAITNSMVFSNYNFAEKILKAGLTRINISIHSHIHELENYLTGIPGGLQRKLKAIDNFNILINKGHLKSPLSINIVLNKINYKEILKTVLYFYRVKNVSDIRINFVWLSYDVKENWEELKISYTEFLPYLKKLIYISIKEKIRITFDTIPSCIFYKIDKKNYKKIIKKFLGENLDHITEIDWTNNNTNFNWQEKKKDILKTKFKQCDKCLYKNSCQGVWKEYYEIYGSDEFTPILF
ncbi:MAG: radical SAM protein [Candidatus Gracilibacteria bacterium]|nr:radical SAM protein [Candidatus Gracilibacteria bacterium]